MTHIVLVIDDGATDTDMARRELLARSLLQLQHAAGVGLSFVAKEGDTSLSEKLLALVGNLLEGTTDQCVRVTLGPLRNANGKPAKLDASAAVAAA